MPMTYVSAFERLQSLPAIFSGRDLTIRFQWTSKTASQYLYLWKKRGLVEGLGGLSDVYVSRTSGQSADWEAALRRAMPSAVIAGTEALRRAGWSTQIPTRPEAAVRADQPHYTLDRFEIMLRPKRWFECMAPGIDRSGAMPVLKPGWALADLVWSQGWGRFGLDPDDIEPDTGDAEDDPGFRVATDTLAALPSPRQRRRPARRP